MENKKLQIIENNSLFSFLKLFKNEKEIITRSAFMSIGKKLSSAFITLILLLAVAVISSFWGFYQISQQTEEALDYRLEQLLLATEIRHNVEAESMYLRAVVLAPKDESQRGMLQVSMDELDQNLLDLEQMIQSSEFKSYWEEATTTNEEIKKMIPIVLDATNTGNIDGATEFVNKDMEAITSRQLKAVQEMVSFQTKQMEENNQDIHSAIRMARLISLVVFAVSVMVAIGLMRFARKSITLPLRKVIHVAKDFGEGNLTTEDVKITSKDELGQLAKIFNSAKHHLRELIVLIQENADQLSASSQELSANDEELLAKIEEVAHQTEQTADLAQGSASASNESSVAMDETAQGVQRIAEASQGLFDSSNQANDVAKKGTTVIAQAKEQMATISSSSTFVHTLVQELAERTAEIENIVQVITGITDQTNLLALNATIEAARAGEQGKGFLVVAEEIRKLADESKQSAHSITSVTTVIKEDTKKVVEAMTNTLPAVEKGVEIIGDAGESFESIVLEVHQMIDQIQDVSTTAEELAASAEEVSASVSEISTGSQLIATNIDSIALSMQEQTAAIEDVTKVAISVSETAQQLKEETMRFKV